MGDLKLVDVKLNSHVLCVFALCLSNWPNNSPGPNIMSAVCVLWVCMPPTEPDA
jgi:hypothetical protein